MEVKIDTLKVLQDLQRNKVKMFISEDEGATFSLPLKFISEIGSLANSISNNFYYKNKIENKEDLYSNIASVLFYLIEISNKFDIDLETAFISKQKINIERFSNNDIDLLNQLKGNKTLNEIQSTNTNIRKHWTGYNDMRFLPLAFMNEAGELMEAYLKKVHIYHKTDLPDEDKSSLKHEIADCFIYLLGIATSCNCDIEKEYKKKLEEIINEMND